MGIYCCSSSKNKPVDTFQRSNKEDGPIANEKVINKMNELSHIRSSMKSSTKGFQEKPLLFELKWAAISVKRSELVGVAVDGLGEDSKSKHFMLRKKSIAYAIIVNSKVYCLQTDNYFQSDSYNDFSIRFERKSFFIR